MNKTVLIGSGVSLIVITIVGIVLLNKKKVISPSSSPVYSPRSVPSSSPRSVPSSSPSSSSSLSNVKLDGVYTIQSTNPKATYGGYLGINTLNTTSERVCLNAKTDTTYNQWTIKPVSGSPGLYTLQSTHPKAANGGYLGIDKLNKTSNTVKLDSKTDTTFNQWIITSSDNSFTIRSDNPDAGSSVAGKNGGYLGIDISNPNSNLAWLNINQAIDYNQWYINSV